MVVNNKLYEATYNRVASAILSNLINIKNNRKFGRAIDYDKVKTLNVFIKYLDRIKNSNKEYTHVKGLTGIVKYLNRM